MTGREVTVQASVFVTADAEMRTVMAFPERDRVCVAVDALTGSGVSLFLDRAAIEPLRVALAAAERELTDQQNTTGAHTTGATAAA